MDQPHQSCGPYIKWINDAIAAEANRNLKGHNLTLSQSHVLMHLYRREDRSAPLKALENLLEVSQPTMAGLTARLEDKGLIESFADPRDRRIKHIRLTPQGAAICEACRQEIMATEQRLTATLTAEECQQLLSLLHRIHRSLR